MGPGPFPVWRSTRIMTMTMTMITRLVSSRAHKTRSGVHTGLGLFHVWRIARLMHHDNDHSSCQFSDTKLGVESTGLGLFPVWRNARIMTMTMTMILVLSSSLTQNSEWRVQALAYSLFGRRPARIWRDTRVMQNKCFKVFPCRPRVTWNEVGLHLTMTLPMITCSVGFLNTKH